MGFYIFKKNRLMMSVMMAFAVAMVLFPEETEAGSKAAILIWANSILPVLLPFFIISDLMKKLGMLDRLPPQVYPAAVAFMSGYPMGAKAVGDLAARSKLSHKKAGRVLSYSMITGPAFLVATIGQFLGDVGCGWIVAIGHYLGAVANGFLWTDDGKPLTKIDKYGVTSPAGEPFSVEQISQSVLSGCKAMAIVLAYLMIAMIGMNFIEKSGAFELLGNETIEAVIRGFFEMTAGISMVGTAEIAMNMKVILSTFMVSFGGLSVIGQSVSMAGMAGFTFKEIFIRKFTHGLLAGIFSMILVRLML